MHLTKYTRLRTDCQAALADANPEKCLELLAESLDERTEAYDEYVAMSSRLNKMEREKRLGIKTSQEHSAEYANLTHDLLQFLKSLKDSDVSLLRRIHDFILIVACKNSPTDWEKLFPDAFFSHVQIIQYGKNLPTDFKPDVVIFDDLDCSVKNRIEMLEVIGLAAGADLLYFGLENPFKEGLEEEKTIFARMANANSRFTIHARLRELLEFRKIYGQD